MVEPQTDESVRQVKATPGAVSTLASASKGLEIGWWQRRSSSARLTADAVTVTVQAVWVRTPY